MADSRALVLKILGDVSSLNKSMKDAQNSVNGAGMSIEKSFDQVKKAVTVASAAVVGFAVAYGKTAVNAASDLAETIAKSQVIFGNNAAQIEAWGATAATAFGQSQRQALDAAATFAIFGKAAGLAGNDLIGFSTDFVELASDLASFNNTTPEEAIIAIGAALRGESEPIRRYGVLINEAALRQAALEIGIVNTTKNALTPQQRVLAAQKLIFEQTTAAQGDYERTSDGLANSQRSLKAQIEDVNAEIGEKLLPFIITITKFISETAIPFVTKYKDELQILAGVFVALSVAVLAVNAALKVYQAALVVATVAQAAFNAVIAGNPIGLIVIAVAAVVAAFIKLESQTGMLRKAWEWLTEKIKAALDWFKKVANFFGADFETAAEKHQKTMQRNNEVYDESRRGANQVADSLRMGVLPAMKSVNEESSKLPTVLDSVAAGFDDVAASSRTATQQIENQTRATEHLARVQQKLGADPTGANAVAAARGLRAGRAIAGLGAGVNAISLEGAAAGSVLEFFADMAKRDKEQTGRDLGLENAALLNVRFSDLIEAGLGGASFDAVGRAIQQLTVEGALTGGFLSRPTGSQSLGELVGGRANQINININGTVVNPEGTARAITNVLQNSNARSGVGVLTPVLGLE